MSTAYDSFTFTHGGRNFIAELHTDDCGDAPWKRSDGHGPVTDWLRRDKQPGEWLLSEDGGSKRFYDAAAALRMAKCDGWGIGEDQKAALIARLSAPRILRRPKKGEKPSRTASGFLYLGMTYRADQIETVTIPGRDPAKPLTTGEIRAEAVRLDFEFLRGWCTDKWHYCGVAVRAVDADGEPMGDEFEHALWGIESNDSDGIREVAEELAGQFPPLADIVPGMLVRTIAGEMDSDEHGQDRRAPAGAVGRIGDTATVDSWNVTFPNGCWVILDLAELRDESAYELIPVDSPDYAYWAALFPAAEA